MVARQRGGAPPKRNAAAARARGSGGGRGNNDIARQSYSTRTKYQQPRAIAVYDGRHFRGSVLPQAGKWVAFDANGHRIGIFDLRRRAEHALYRAHRPDGGR